MEAHVGPIIVGAIGPKGRLDVIGKTLNQLFLLYRDRLQLSNELKQLVEQ